MQHSTGTSGITHSVGGSDLADVLERVLDKGVVVTADIRIKVVDVELLTINVRLVLASVDRAKEMGIDWWEGNPFLSNKISTVNMNRKLDEKDREILALQKQVKNMEKNAYSVVTEE